MQDVLITHSEQIALTLSVVQDIKMKMDVSCLVQKGIEQKFGSFTGQFAELFASIEHLEIRTSVLNKENIELKKKLKELEEHILDVTA